jgi:hypothetical protein
MEEKELQTSVKNPVSKSKIKINKNEPGIVKRIFG